MTAILRIGLAGLFTGAIPICTIAQSPYATAKEPTSNNSLTTLPGNVMFEMPGLFKDFIILGGGQFVQRNNGTAHLTGRVASAGSLYSAFLIDIEFTGKVTPGNPGHPPAGGPQLLMNQNAYAPQGPINPSSFAFYTSASGTLTGSSNYLGGIIDLQLTGGPAQIGIGANNHNSDLGLQASFQPTVAQHPRQHAFPALGVMTLAVDLLSDRTDKVTHPPLENSLSTLTFSRAMSIPGVADDYVFVPAGEFTEFEDGHAELHGRLARQSALDDAWDLTLTLTDRVDPGEPNHPPQNSPVLMLLSAAYTAGGGIIDPGHWHYYETVTATLTGLEINNGAVIDLQAATAFQVGGGCNQHNSFYGYYGAVTPTLLSQPLGRSLAITGDIELHGLCQTFPELPLPSLTPPPTPYTLPTLTDQGIVIQGNNLAWVELVGIGQTMVSRGDKSDWFRGWFETVDDNHLIVHPRPGMPASTYDMSAFTPSWRSNVQYLDLLAPTTPTLMSERSADTNAVLHFLIHQGSLTGPALSAVAMSDSLLPTLFPGLLDLDIGNQNLELLIIPGTFLHQSQTGIARYDFGPVPPWYTGFLTHFQAVTFDITNVALPLPTSNVWTVTF